METVAQGTGNRSQNFVMDIKQAGSTERSQVVN